MSDRERANARSKAWYAANRERARARQSEYRTENLPAIKAQKKAAYEQQRDDPKFIAALRAYGAKTKDHKREYDRAYREKNAENLADMKIEWRARNIKLIRSISMSYKARRRAQETGGDTTRQICDWAEAQPKTCFWCFEDCGDKFQIDHFVPLARGGQHACSNLVISCPPCNRKKSASDPYEFAERIGRRLAA